MNFVAIKMLVGDRVKYIGIVTGLTFASLLITQQAAIFIGVMTWTFGMITDNALPDIWVMDPKVQFVDDGKPVMNSQLYRVRGITGVEWAVPMYRGMMRVRLQSGILQECLVLGLDDATLVGGPPKMVEGEITDLKLNDAIIVNTEGAQKRLATRGPHGELIPLKVGDTLEINDHRAIVQGLCKTSRTFIIQPIIYTTFSRATTFAPYERRMMNFVLVKAKKGQNHKELCHRIRETTGLAAYPKEEFKWLTMWYYLKNTGLPINFGLAVLMGFIIGAAIAGQTFYNFTQDNLRYFGALKAMGATNPTLLKMIVLQALVVAGIGYGLGVGAASLMGTLTKNTSLTFLMPWQLLILSAATVLIISILSAAISIVKVMRLEPAIVFKS